MSDASEKVICIIPAKLGSVRLPRKNLLHLGGISLLGRAIDKALCSSLFDYIHVSSESDEVLSVARDHGIDVPFLRPVELSVDPSGVADVCLYVLRKLESEHKLVFDTLVILLPTSPFVKIDDLRRAMNIYKKGESKFLMSVVQEEKTVLSSLVKTEQGLLPLHPDFFFHTGAKKGTHEPNIFRSNGAITIVDVKAFCKVGDYYGFPISSYEMPAERSLDIDTEYEYLVAQTIISARPDLLID